MTISIIAIKDCFKDAEEGSRVVPHFNFLDIEDDSPFRFMRMQPKEALAASPDEGVRHTSGHHLKKCREALRTAHMERADLLLTPEYCIPAELIIEIIQNSELQPRPNTLWCLGCQGMSLDSFRDHMMQWGDSAIVGSGALAGMRENRFVNFLLYVFRSKESSKLCLVPQLKLQRMREPLFVCEGAGLSLGKKVIMFGDQSANQLFSIMCADAFHPEIKSGGLFFPNREPRRYIILHPQLNPAPRSPDIAALRNRIFDQTSSRNVIYITSNWAYGTIIQTEDGRPLAIQAPWSSIYRRFISLDGRQSWNEQLREARSLNFRHGLGLGFQPAKKIKVWFAIKSEHLQLILLTKPYDGGAELVQPRAGVQAEKAFIASDSGNWEHAELPFSSELPAVLAEDAVEEFAYPRTASVENLDKFFGYCLGHLEDGQLSLSDQEHSTRLSCHIDEQCEPGRGQEARRIVRLIRCLRQKDSLPNQLKKFEGNFLFQLGARAPINLLPSSGDEKDGALVIYTDNDVMMDKIVFDIYKALPGVELFLEDKICVFSQNPKGETVHYPYFSELWTSPVHSNHSTEFTQGGLLIDAGLD
ncbi:hypothetical protein [Paenibacillus sp. GCM10027626]|uniref:hypothetical protein n=1 Tax=Paenibacillus sp. GCM10027626 TaxID=3273411 RepID=UPI0036360E3D